MKWLNGNRCFGLFLLLAVYSAMSAPSLFADDAEARAIMERVDARDEGDNQAAHMKMILIDKKNRERVRKIVKFTKDKGEDKYRLFLDVRLLWP